MDTQELLKSAPRPELEAWCRKNAQSVYLGEAVLCRVLGKYLMFALPNDRSLMPHLALDGYWEMWITMAIADYVRPGMTCIDVGANVGYYSVLMTDWVGHDGRVFAIEPEGKNFSALVANAERAGKHCVPLRFAASDKKGTAKLMVVPNHGADHFVVDADVHDPRACPTDLRTLDEELAYQNHFRVDFIKMDVEGHERAVWRGMPELLARNPQVQIAAEWMRSHDPKCELGQMALDAGFELYEVHTDGKLRPIALDRVAEADWRMLWFKR